MSPKKQTDTLRVETVPIDKLVFKAKNPNAMDAEDYASLVRLIKREGAVLQPILVDESFEIIDGEHRARAAAEAGLKAVSAVVVTSTRADSIRRTLSMNRLRGRAVDDIVTLLLRELDMTAPELADCTGFTQTEIEMLLSGTVEPTTRKVEFEATEGLKTYKMLAQETACPVIDRVLASMEAEGVGKAKQLEALCVNWEQGH